MALTKIDDRGLKTPIDLLDNEKIRFGTGNDLEIFHDATHTYINNTTGDLRITDTGGGGLIIGSNSLNLRNSARDENYFVGNVNGSVDLYYNNSKKFETTSTGAQFSGQSGSHTDVTILGYEGQDANLNLYADEGDDNADKWRILSSTDGSFYLQNYTSGSWENNIKATGNGVVELYHDNVKKLNTGTDGVTISGDATDTRLYFYNSGGTYKGRVETNNSDEIKVITASGDNAILCANNGAVELYHNGAKKFETLSNGCKITDSDTTAYLTFTNSAGNNGYVMGEGTDIIGFKDTNPHWLVKATKDAAVELYYDNSKKLETTSTGVTVTGTGYVSGGWRPSSSGGASLGSSSYRWYDLNISNDIDISDNGKILIGDGDDLKLYHDGNNSLINADGTGSLIVQGADDIYIRCQNGEDGIKAIGNGAVELYYDNGLRAYTSTNGFQVYKPSSDDVEFRIVNDQNMVAGATNTILSQHDGRTTAKIVFGRNNDNSDFSAAAAATQGDIQFWTTQGGTLTQHGKFINAGYLHVCNDGNFVDCDTNTHTVRSTGANWTFRAVNSHPSTPYGVHAYFNNSNPDTGGYPFFLGQDQTATRFRVQSNGDVENHDNSYGSISDIKLKENIVDAESQWGDIKAIKVRNFNFKASKSKKKLLGVVAQELETTSPGLVVETPDEDLDHNDLGTTTKSVRYSILYMKAIKALQEAMVRIETLETEVANLKG